MTKTRFLGGPPKDAKDVRSTPEETKQNRAVVRIAVMNHILANFPESEHETMIAKIPLLRHIPAWAESDDDGT